MNLQDYLTQQVSLFIQTLVNFFLELMRQVLAAFLF